MNKRGKKAQLTIFIILAIVIVAVIVFLFFLYNSRIISINPFKDPKGYFNNCMQKEIDQAIKGINSEITSKNLTINLKYNGEEIPYLCYTEKNNELCDVTLAPLTNVIKKQLEDSLKLKVDSCFNLLEKSLKQYNYESEPAEFYVQILPSQILLSINKELSFEKAELKQRYSNFDISRPNDLFDLIMISNEILNQETDCMCKKEFCNADIIKLSEENKEYTIIRDLIESDKKIYILRDSKNDLEFKFGVRNCIKDL